MRIHSNFLGMDANRHRERMTALPEWLVRYSVKDFPVPARVGMRERFNGKRSVDLLGARELDDLAVALEFTIDEFPEILRAAGARLGCHLGQAFLHVIGF